MQTDGECYINNLTQVALSLVIKLSKNGEQILAKF